MEGVLIGLSSGKAVKRVWPYPFGVANPAEICSLQSLGGGCANRWVWGGGGEGVL